MDYGQPKQSNPVSQPIGDFFTTGAGTNQNSRNDFEPENNLDLSSDGAASWGQTPERDSRKIGSGAITSSLGNQAPIIETENRESSTSFDPQMPPGYPDIIQTSNDIDEDNSLKEGIIDFSSFKEERKSISPKTLEATEKAISDFNKGKINPSELSNIRWEGVKSYVKNSFNRDLAA